MRVLYLLVCIGLIGCPILGCAGEGESGGSSDAGSVVEQAGDAVKEAAQEAVGDVAEQAGNAVEEYKAKAMDKLAEYEKGLEPLKDAVKAVDNEELAAAVNGIEEKIDGARGAVSDLKVDELTDLDAHKSQLESQMGEIKGEMDKAREMVAGLKEKMPKIPG